MILALSAINSHVAEIPCYSKDFSAPCLVGPDSDLCWLRHKFFYMISQVHQYGSRQAHKVDVLLTS